MTAQSFGRRVRGWPGELSASVRQPATQTDLRQMAKATVATVAAWLVAVHVFGSDQPFLAPWTALLTVHATFYRTVRRGVESVAATAVGIGLSFVAATLFGPGWMALGLVTLLGLLVSRTALLREEGVTAATTALFVLTSGYERQQGMVLERLLDVAVGVVIGVVVNFVMIPPLNNRSAQAQVDQINRKLGGLLEQMAAEMRSTWTEERSGDWLARTRELDDDLAHAWQVIRHARESGRWNPRRRLPSRHKGGIDFGSVLVRLEDGIAQTRSIARVVHESTRSATEWDPGFRDPWLALLTETGRRVADPDADVGELHARVDELTRSLSVRELPQRAWPVYGTLITNLGNIIDIVDDVTSSRRVRA